MATPTELERVAAAMHALRPDWRLDSLATFLAKHHAHRPYRDLAVAAATVATDPRTRTPQLLNEAGPWWSASQVAFDGAQQPTAVPRPEDARCAVPGHDHELARNCRACRSEALARQDDDTPDGPTLTQLSPEQRDRNARGARNVRRALGALREDHP